MREMLFLYLRVQGHIHLHFTVNDQVRVVFVKVSHAIPLHIGHPAGIRSEIGIRNISNTGFDLELLHRVNRLQRDLDQVFHGRILIDGTIGKEE